MNDGALIELVLNVLECSQKDLAKQLDVSAAQISKWKKGDYMSRDMQLRLRELAGIGEMEPEFVLWAGTVEDALKWRRLMRYQAEMAKEGAETGYNTYLLDDSEIDFLCWNTFSVLKELGLDIPNPFPKDLDFDYEEDDDSWEILEENVYAGLIQNIYRALNDVYGFYAAYISELMNDDRLGLMDTEAEGIEPSLLSLAATKLTDIPSQAVNFRAFRHRVTQDFEKWLSLVKKQAFQFGVPLRAEVMDLAYGSADELSHSAEAESFGINESRIHPDIYMNELLVGMRAIHQVLPAILKKLEIEDEFKLDVSQLRVHPNR